MTGIKLLNKIPLAALLICAFYCGVSCVEETYPFTGEVNSNGINIRSDSTVTSKEICRVPKKTRLEVVSGLYGWYKVRLPEGAPCYIRKDMAKCTLTNQNEGTATQISKECQTARVIKENVNIRLAPNQASFILGKAGNEELLTIIREEGEWYKIAPTKNTFGWINNKFVTRVESASHAAK